MNLLAETNSRRGVTVRAPQVRRQPQQQPQAPQPVAGPLTGSTLQQLAAIARQAKAQPQEMEQQAPGGFGKLVDNPVGGALGGVAKMVFGNPVSQAILKPLEVLQYPAAGVRATVKELVDVGSPVFDAIPGVGAMPGSDRSFDLGDLKQNTLDKKGFGELLVEPIMGPEGTDRPLWMRQLAGFVGDVASDPFSYVTGGSVAITGKAQRSSLAARASMAGMPDEVVQRVARFGPSALDDAQLVQLGERAHGLYAGMGNAKVRLPGTGGINRAATAAGGAVRAGVNELPGMTGVRRWRAPEGLEDALEKLSTGRGAMTASAAAERVAWENKKRLEQGAFTKLFRQEMEHRARGLKGVDAQTLTHQAETEGGTWLNDLMKRAADYADDKGVKIPQRTNYVPHVWTKDARTWLRSGSPDAVAVRNTFDISIDDLDAASGVTLSRKIIARDKPYEINGKEILIREGTIREINSAMREAFPGIDFQMLDDNATSIAANYFGRLGEDIGKVQASKFLATSKSGLTRSEADKEVLREVLDEDATKVANQEASKELENEARRLSGSADRLWSGVTGRVEVSQGVLREYVTDALDDVKSLRTETRARLDSLYKNEKNLVKNRQRLLDTYDSEVASVDRRLASVNEELRRLERDADERIGTLEALKPGLRAERAQARQNARRRLKRKLEAQRASLEMDRETLSALRAEADLLGKKEAILSRNAGDESFTALYGGEAKTVGGEVELGPRREVFQGQTPENVTADFARREQKLISNYSEPQPVTIPARTITEEQRSGYARTVSRLTNTGATPGSGAIGKARMQAESAAGQISALDNMLVGLRRTMGNNPSKAETAALRKAEAEIAKLRRIERAAKAEIKKLEKAAPKLSARDRATLADAKAKLAKFDAESDEIARATRMAERQSQAPSLQQQLAALAEEKKYALREAERRLIGNTPTGTVTPTITAGRTRIPARTEINESLAKLLSDPNNARMSPKAVSDAITANYNKALRSKRAQIANAVKRGDARAEKALRKELKKMVADGDPGQRFVDAISTAKTIQKGSFEPKAAAARAAEDASTARAAVDYLMDAGAVDQSFADNFDNLRLELDDVTGKYRELPSAYGREKVNATAAEVKRRSEFALRYEAAIKAGASPNDSLGNYIARKVIEDEREAVSQMINDVKKGGTQLIDAEVEQAMDVVENLVLDINNADDNARWARQLLRMRDLSPAEEIAQLRPRIDFNEQWQLDRTRTLRNMKRRLARREGKAAINLQRKITELENKRAGAQGALNEMKARLTELENGGLTRQLQGAKKVLEDILEAPLTPGQTRVLRETLGVDNAETIRLWSIDPTIRSYERVDRQFSLFTMLQGMLPNADADDLETLSSLAMGGGAANALEGAAIMVAKDRQTEALHQFSETFKDLGLRSGGDDANRLAAIGFDRGSSKLDRVKMRRVLTERMNKQRGISEASERVAVRRRNDAHKTVAALRQKDQATLTAAQRRRLLNAEAIIEMDIGTGNKGLVGVKYTEQQRLAAERTVKRLTKIEERSPLQQKRLDAANNLLLASARERAAMEGATSAFVSHRLNELAARRERLSTMERALGKRAEHVPDLDPLRLPRTKVDLSADATTSGQRMQAAAAEGEFAAYREGLRADRIRAANTATRTPVARVVNANWREVLGSEGRGFTAGSPAAQERMLRGQLGQFNDVEAQLNTRLQEIGGERVGTNLLINDMEPDIFQREQDLGQTVADLEQVSGSLTPDVDAVQARVQSMLDEQGRVLGDEASTLAQGKVDLTRNTGGALRGLDSIIGKTRREILETAQNKGLADLRNAQLAADWRVISQKSPRHWREGSRYLQDLEKVAASNIDRADPQLTLVESLLRDAGEQLLKTAELDMAAREVRTMQSAAAKGQLHKVFTTTLADGWKPMAAELTKSGEGLVMAQELADMMFRATTASRDGSLWKVFNAYTDFFKTYATATPGFHVRNGLSATFMNFTDGVDAKYNLEAIRLWKQMRKDPMKYLDSVDERTRTAFDAAFASGAGGQFTERGVGPHINTTSKVFNNPLTRGSKWLGEYVEGPARLAMALDTIDKGGDAMRALDRISRVHFDYAQISSMDARAKVIFTFWTFMSRNLPLQLTQMWMKPKTYLRYQYAVDNFKDENDPMTPQYWLEQGAFTLGGKLGGDPLYLAPDLPHTRLGEDVRKLNDPARLLADLNPALRVPLETMVADRKLYTGAPFQDGQYEKLDAELAPLAPLFALLGQTATGGTSGDSVVTEKGAYAARQLIPTMQLLSRLFPSEGDQFNENRQEQTIARFFGVPAYQLTEQAKQGEARRRRAVARGQQRTSTNIASL